MAGSRWIFLSVLCVALLAAPLTLARDLSFDERVVLQSEIEATYYRHQKNATRPFAEAVPRDVLERRVRGYLDQSALLARYWKTEITGLMLRRELERIAADTQMPERLHELYAALGDDRFLVEECLARATLVSRLAQQFYAYDERVHALQKTEATALREKLLAGVIDPGQEHSRRSVVTLVPHADDDAGFQPGDERQLLELESEEFEQLAASGVGTIGAVEERRGAFVLRVVLDVDAAEIRVANYIVRKQPWDRWWKEKRAELIGTAVAAVSRGGAVLPEPGGVRAGDCLPDDSWINASLDDVPDPRAYHEAIWTGSLMLVWGGNSGATRQGTGSRYDPATDRWSAMATLNAPEPRYRHTTIWTGTEMIVWGGYYDVGPTGGRYDPLADSWTPTSTVGAPTERESHTAVWTGDRMIVWGGYNSSTELNDGAAYDPGTDTWSPIQSAGAPEPRFLHTAVWTGDRMIVWGGRGESEDLNTGGRYDPDADAWAATSLTQAPGERLQHTAVWTGSEMVIWGGYDFTVSQPLKTGGAYDPDTNTWRVTAFVNGPTARRRHTAVWAQNRMLVWGGGHCNAGPAYNTGGWYFPTSNQWFQMNTTNAPTARCDHSAIWTGERMIVWGGDILTVATDSGGRYDPFTDNWTPTGRGSAPEGRDEHTAVWTGSRMIVWGGTNPDFADPGATYDPATDSWQPIPATDAPDERRLQGAVWTGSEMVIWGGFSTVDGAVLDDGGRYDPLTEQWAPISSSGAPIARSWHSTVWAGDRMFIWGGYSFGLGMLNDGGYYRPSIDTWNALPPSGALLGARSNASAVWTGDEVILWGGWTGSHVVDGGARYSPAAQSWLPVSDVNSPSARSGHAAVWVGGRMVIWGGSTQTGSYDTGALYDPVTDSWVETSTVDAPAARATVVGNATNRGLLVWGIGEYGGYYRPDTDTWAPTTIEGHPSPRPDPTVVWTGGTAIYWGGYAGGLLRSGGCYSIEQQADVDQDGLTVCAGDCNDADPTVFAHPSAIDDLLFTGRTTLEWGSDAMLSGPGTVYDLLISDLSDLPVDRESPSGCLENDLAATTVELEERPRPGTGLYVLVRGDNSCGPGSYGFRSGGTPRVSPSCP